MTDTQAKYRDVPLDQIQVGDLARIDGIGWILGHNGVELYGREVEIKGLSDRYVCTDVDGVKASFRLSSITAARRVPNPKPGDWQCRYKPSDLFMECDLNGRCKGADKRVYRSPSFPNGGWSWDQRKGGGDRRKR